MQAIRYTSYGGPEVLQLVAVEKPTPQPDQLLVKIHAAAANPLDWHHMRADPFLVRLGKGLFGPKDPRLGADIAGRVEAVGSAVTEFQPGDAVFGEIAVGGFADYVAVSPANLAAKPANLTFAEAASIPVVGFTALQGLRKGGIKAGQQVLVNGASGGVGTAAVQIAKAFGAEVTGVCSGRNLELVRSIGADHVVDYTQEDFTQSAQKYDLLYDAIGNRSVAAYKRALKPAGVCVVAGFTTLGHMVGLVAMGAWVSKTSAKQIGSMGAAQPNQADLATLKTMLEDGQLTPVIDRTYPLAETAAAIRYLETGRARGKVIIAIAESDQR